MTRSRSTAARLAAGLALLIAWLAGCGHGPSVPGPQDGPASPAAAGPRLQDPPELVSHDGVLKAGIVVERRKVRVGDRRLWATTYNGMYMPPTLRVRPGDTIDLTMTNKVDEDTNLHVHGLHASPRSPSDDIFIAIKYGSSYHYTYRLPRDITPGTYAARKTVVFTENAAGTVFYVNGRTYDPKRNDFTSVLGTVEEWTVRNDSDEEHSFHVHTNQFQLMSTDGKPHPPSRRWFDTVNVPARGRVVLRIPFRDFTGRTVLHCHILNHEDMGMMAVLDIVRPSGRSRDETRGK